MSLSRTWYSDANVALPDVSSVQNSMKSYAWTLAALLLQNVSGTHGAEGPAPVSAKWNCEGSSDGATAGLDGNNRWLATFDITKLVNANAGSAHSWMALSKTFAGQKYWLLIDLGTVTTSNLSIYISRVGFTGGTTTARPTATDEIGVVSSGQVIDTTIGASNMNMVRDANGAFDCFWLRLGTGAVEGFLSYVDADNVPASDQWKVWCTFHFNTTVGACMGTALSAATIAGRVYNLTQAGTHGLGVLAIYGSSGTSGWHTLNVGASPTEGATDAPDVFFWTTTSSFAGFRGKAPDWKVANASIPYTVDPPSPAVPERFVVGSIAIPFTAPVTM